jgi:hypothetical protein
MSDPTTPGERDSRGSDGALLPSQDALATSVRRLKIWLGILTGIVALLIVCTIGAVGMSVVGLGIIPGALQDMPGGPSVSDTRQQVQDAFGSQIQRLEVREVTQDFGGPPFPYSLIDGSSGMKTVYVEYQLKGTDVVVAGVLGDGPFGSDAAASGMIPTKGSLASRMTPDEFKRLLAAYGAETRSPLASVRRYNDQSIVEPDGNSAAQATVTVGSKDFAAKELWIVTEGKIIKGDKVSTDEMMMGRKAYVLREDPATGAFTSLGSEPADYGG